MWDRFWPKVHKTNRCWVWQACRSTAGYGMIWDGTRNILAHRAVYELLVGPIPDGLQLDHLCRNRACVNPAHLEAVTCAENIQRGLSGVTRGRQQRSKTHCPQGHEYTIENTRLYRNRRYCRTCKKERPR